MQAITQSQLFTIGHSNRALEDFLALLRDNQIRAVADVRRFAGSAKHPHFSHEALQRSLEGKGIYYRHFEALGGRRKPHPDSRNIQWQNSAFRGYADYMETPEFREAMTQLVTMAHDYRTAVMCAEAVWWRCHRRLIADYIQIHPEYQLRVYDILGPKPPKEHPKTEMQTPSTI